MSTRGWEQHEWSPPINSQQINQVFRKGQGAGAGMDVGGPVMEDLFCGQGDETPGLQFLPNSRFLE